MNIQNLARELIERHEPRGCVPLQFQGLSIDVRCNCEALTGRLADYFRSYERHGPRVPADLEVVVLEAALPSLPGGFRVQPREDPAKPLKEEFLDVPGGGRVVRKVRTGMVFLCGAGLDLAVGPCAAHDNQVINFINSRFLQWVLGEDGLLLHAAAVARGPAGLALSGFAGMGKSTLALHLLARGWQFVSNDRLVVQPSGGGLVMHGIPKQPRVNPGTLLHNPKLQHTLPEARRRELAGLAPQALWDLEDKRDVDVQRAFGEPQRLSAALSGLLVLNWRHQGPAAQLQRVDLSQRRDLLPAIMKSPGVFIERRAGGDRTPDPGPYLQRLAACPVYEVTGRIDFEAATEACADLSALTGGPGTSRTS